MWGSLSQTQVTALAVRRKANGDFISGPGLPKKTSIGIAGRLAVVARQLGLRVEGVHRARAALHEQPDDGTRPRGDGAAASAAIGPAVAAAPASSRSRPSRSASASIPKPGAARSEKVAAIRDPRRRRVRSGSWSNVVHRRRHPAATLSIDVEELVEGEQHVAKVGERVRAVAGREERDAPRPVRRRAAAGRAPARRRGGRGPADRARPPRPRAGPGRVAQPRTNGSFSSARFWVGTAVVFRRPHVAVESGASNTSASGLATDRLMKA